LTTGFSFPFRCCHCKGQTVYWGSGYANINGTPNNKLYAFELSNTKNNKFVAADEKQINIASEETLWAQVSPHPVGKGVTNLTIYRRNSGGEWSCDSCWQGVQGYTRTALKNDRS